MSAMMRATLLLAFLSATAAHRAEPAGHNSGAGVASMLAEVEQKWEQWALATADCGSNPLPNCTTNSTGAKNAFAQSCATVSRAVIGSSAGDKTRVQSYMADVCQADVLKGDKAELCLDYAQVLAQGMSEFQHENTDDKMDLPAMCLEMFANGYLGQKISKETERRKQDVDARAAEEQAKADAAEAARNQAEADARAAAARKHLVEVANATAVVTQKREQAVRASVEAQRKAQEVEQSEAVAKRLQEEAQLAAKEAAAAAANLTKTKAGNTSAHGLALIRKSFRARKSFLATFPVTFS